MIEDSKPVIIESRDVIGKNNDLEIAQDILSAKEMLRQNKKKYDCLIVDMDLPDGMGYDLIKEIRNDEGFYNKKTKIIVYSSYLMDYFIVQNAFENGADYYIQKSPYYEKFEEMIRGFLSE